MSRNDARIYFCAVRAWFHIVARFLELMGESKLDCPLAVYFHQKSRKPRYVTSTMVTAEMRSLVVDVHKLTKKEDIDRFSSHSLRVGAACIFLQLATTWHLFNVYYVGKATYGKDMFAILFVQR